MRRRHEHLVGHEPAAACDRAKADAGEDVGIVALPWHKSGAVEVDRTNGLPQAKIARPPVWR